MRPKAMAIAAASAAVLCVTADGVAAQNVVRDYGPYPDNRVLFGDTHLHTSYSTDAGMRGITLGPEDAFRFARGEEVRSSTGQRTRLRRPLDFLVVSDHAEDLALAIFIEKSDPKLLADPLAKKWHDLSKAGKSEDAFLQWLAMLTNGKGDVESPELKRAAWSHETSTADQYNEPGRFTAFIGFEWTSQPGGNNLHRVVIFRDDAKHADQVLPFSTYDSADPEDLWKFMAAYETKTGGHVLAIPHNGNLSNGAMFAVETMSKKPFDRDYATRRAKWEPLFEVTQSKGTSETHPLLSPTDEFADFALMDKSNINFSSPKQPAMLQFEYARPALERGLGLDAKLGVNPFKFGLIGSTDNHTGLATTDEDNWFEPSPDRIATVLFQSPTDPALSVRQTDLSASGLAAVWARENTREAIFDALKRKEAYGTTGTRLVVRLFAGWDFTAADLERSDFAAQGYTRGVPMGGDLRAASPGRAPTFLVRALRDPDGANLDRIQVVKGWLGDDGATHEKIYDVAVSDGRKPGADGKIPPVGNTVDVAAARYTNTIGAPLLSAFWKDPAFDPKQRAFYYARVIEIPTPRWIAYDAKFYGVEAPKGVRMFSQERAFTSPVWYTPAK
jgi:hypothetical protein